jgi:hypothetical protein
MKKNLLLILPLILVTVFMLLPVNQIFADNNLVTNGDFSNIEAMSAPDWRSNDPGVWISDDHWAIIDSAQNGNSTSYLWQNISTNCSNLTLYFDVLRKDAGLSDDSSIKVYFTLVKNNSQTGDWAPYDYGNSSQNFPDDNWYRDNRLNMLDVWNDWSGGADLQPFDGVQLSFLVDNGGEAWFDNVRLKCNDGGEAEEEEIWVRNHEFQCWQVWINEDNAFEFIFVWEYYNNNHVQILDKDGNIVFYIDLPKGDTHFVADLPDGVYTVQNYHEYGHILREFVIGKP